MAKLSPDQVDQIVAWAEKGKSGLWIAAQLGLKAATVNYRMLSNGFDPWPGKRRGGPQRNPFGPAEDETMLELGARGFHPNKIAELMGRPRTSVRIRIMTLEVRAEKALGGA